MDPTKRIISPASRLINICISMMKEVPNVFLSLIIQVGMDALRYALTNNNRFNLNDTLVGMQGSYIFNDNPYNSYNISASKA